MFKIEDIVIYITLIIILYLSYNDSLNLNNNFHKGICATLIISWLYFKGLRRGLHGGREILPPLKDFFNKADDKE